MEKDEHSASCGSQMEPASHQKLKPKPRKYEEIGPNSAQTHQNSKENNNATTNTSAFYQAALFLPKMSPTWPQLGTPNRAKIIKT